MVLVADASALAALFDGHPTMMGIYQLAEREAAALVLPILPIALASAHARASEAAWEAVLLPPGVYQVSLPMAGAVELASDLLTSYPQASLDDAQVWQTAWEARQLGANARVVTMHPDRYTFLKPPGVIAIG